VFNEFSYPEIDDHHRLSFLLIIVIISS
jgi:hypothetical protein